MRILFVTNEYSTEHTLGTSPCIDQQRQALKRLGFDVDILFFDGPHCKLSYLGAMLQVFWRVQIRHECDLVHAHYGLSGAVARAQARCPVVVTFRGSDVLDRRQRPISRFLARHIDGVIVMTEEMKRLLGRGDAQVIPYGIDLDMFKPASQIAARQELGLDAQSHLILFPYDPRRAEKRFDLAEQAAGLLAGHFSDVRLLAVYNKQHKIMATYMNACDVMLLTSASEGAPVAVREAIACNLPIVSVDVGDVAQVMQGIDGCHICSEAPSSIADALGSVLRARRRTEGYLAAADFELSKSASRIGRLYEELVTSRKDRPEARLPSTGSAR